jgi:hypothetical protein
MRTRASALPSVRPAMHKYFWEEEIIYTPLGLPRWKKDALSPKYLLRQNPCIEAPSGMDNEHCKRLLMTDLLVNHRPPVYFALHVGSCAFNAMEPLGCSSPRWLTL